MAVSARNGIGGYYRVIYSENVRIALRKLSERAEENGMGAEVASAVRTINGYLQTCPMIFGEPRNDLHHTGLHARVGSVKPLVVSFAVDEVNGLVYVVLPFKPLPGTDL